MKNIGSSLTRKLGPLPVWAWALVAFIGIYYYRNKFGSMSGTGTGSVTPGPTTPQSQVTLGPGESAYDPNTGQLVTSPVPTDYQVGAGTGNSGGVDPGQAIDDLANALIAASNAQGSQPAPVVNVTVPSQSTAAPPATKKKPPPKHKAKGPESTTKVEKGGRPRRAKRGSRKQNPPRTGGSSRPRSGGTIRNRVGGRTQGSTGGYGTPARGRSRGTANPPNTRTTSRSRTPTVSQPTVRARPVASHPKPSPKPPPSAGRVTHRNRPAGNRRGR